MHNGDPVSKLNIVCADIGSVAKGNFGWYARTPIGDETEGDDIKHLCDFVIKSIKSGEKVALGFECPLFVPFREDPETLIKARNGETKTNWIAGPGGTVLATGLVQVPWVLKRIRDNLDEICPFYLDWEEFTSASNGLYLWEAFVSGDAKGETHIDDARIAATHFLQTLPNPTKQNAIIEENVISLIGLALLRSGWTNDPKILEKSCLVIKP